MEIENIHSALNIPILIKNLKTANARKAKNQFADYLYSFSTSRCWHSVYFVGSFGGAIFDTVRAYFVAQGVIEHASKSEAKKLKSNPPT